jgi:hypothetical protein
LDEELQIVDVDRNAIGKPKEWILFSLPNQKMTTTSLITLSSLCRQRTMKKPHDKYSKQERHLLTVAASMMQAYTGAFRALEESRGATKDAGCVESSSLEEISTMLEMLQTTSCLQ